MNDKKAQTIAAYRERAELMAKKFDGSAAREHDIDELFAALPANTPNPFIVEIGCGSGRDAVSILTKTNNYLGIDVAPELLAHAQAKSPQARFEVADLETYEFPQGIDGVYASASLIHSPKEVLQEVFARLYGAMLPGGVLFLSMKEKPVYQEFTATNEFGTRTYYYYSEADLRELLAGFEILVSRIEHFAKQEWLEVLVRKA